MFKTYLFVRKINNNNKVKELKTVI